ncbi:SLC13 family permease [uncultured Dysosmobacter sp.]|uniref:SLC13 family permease n=1 Tax=uncultured Dysosmobacter sp. TaxID=2591384 RepID=UPI002603C57A|nr:SLC13 family permease [uncultured Dysosmobacter sp.]
MSLQTESKDTSYYIKSLIGIIIMFGVGFLPPIAGVTELGMRILGIFIGMIYLLCAVEIIWPSMLTIVALGLSGYCSVPDAIASGFGSDIVWMMLILLVLAEGIASSGLGEVMARWIITRKVLNGRPMLFTFIYIVAFGICAPLVTSNVTIVLSWTIFYYIAEYAGYKKGERYSTMLILASFLTSIMYEGLFSFQSWLIALAMIFQEMTGIAFNHVLYFFLGLIALTLMSALIVLAMKYIFKCDFEKLKTIDVTTLKNEEMSKLTKQHKGYILCFVLIVFYIIGTTMIPTGNVIRTFLDSVTQVGWFTIVFCLAIIVRLDGKPLMDFPKVVKNGADWNILLMCAAVIPAARALTSDGTGIKDVMTNILAPILGSMSPVMFVAVVIIVMLILTNLGSNMATGLVMLTIVVPIAEQMSFNPMVIAMAIILVANMGFILPGSSGMASYIYSNKWLTTKDIYKYGLVYCVCFLIPTIAVYIVASYII